MLELLRLMVVEAAGVVTRDDFTPRVRRDVIVASLLRCTGVPFGSFVLWIEEI